MATKVKRPEPVPEPDMKEPEQPADMEIEVAGEDNDDLYTRLKTLQRQLEFFEIQARTSSTQGLRAVLAHRLQYSRACYTLSTGDEQGTD